MAEKQTIRTRNSIHFLEFHMPDCWAWAPDPSIGHVKVWPSVTHDKTLSVSAYVASVSLPSLEGFQEPQAIDEAVKLGLGLVMAGTDHCVCGLRATQAWMGVPEPQVFLCNILSGKISNMYLKTSLM